MNAFRVLVLTFASLAGFGAAPEPRGHRAVFTFAGLPRDESTPGPSGQSGRLPAGPQVKAPQNAMLVSLSLAILRTAPQNHPRERPPARQPRLPLRPNAAVPS